MKTSLTQRLFLAIMLAALLSVLCLVVVMQWNLNRSFLNFIKENEKLQNVRLAQSLEAFYRNNRSWQTLQDNPRLWHQLIFETMHIEETGPPPIPREFSKPPGNLGGGGPQQPRFFLDDKFFLFTADKQLLIGTLKEKSQLSYTELKLNNQTIGFLGLDPLHKLSEARHLDFLRAQLLTFIIVAVVIVLLAAALSLLLARHLTRPLRDLAAATHKLSNGEYSHRVAIAGQDEMARLATDFNSLALTLEKNEQARRQWIADISHELRTPIGILRGEIEAIMDGIRTANDENLLSLHAETLRLGHLIDDLYQLSMSDLGALTYRKSRLDSIALLKQVIDSFHFKMEQQGLALTLSLPARPIFILADAERLRQLFTNILNNSIKYTDKGGKLDISVCPKDKQLEINIQDSAPGVPDQAIAKLFERLYRVESSRNRKTGGAGLGLAICQNIVDAHRGSITAQHAPLGGLWIQILLPANGEDHDT